jgi:murein DD-endopeptidase MepM/ murein hydrolase activator NlpD
MTGVSAYGQPVKSAAELQKMYQQYSAGAPAQQVVQTPPSVSRANTQPAPQASAPAAIQRPEPDYFQKLMRGVQGLFGTTGGLRSSAADEYFDAALQYDAAGDSDTALALYTKAFESDQPASTTNATALQTFASMIPELISEYVTDPASNMNRAAVQQTQSQPAATQPAVTTAAANRALSVGRVVDPSKDVFPSTGAHLDVRVMKDGNYINPETARSILKNLYVGGKPLYTQQDQYKTAAYPITSGFGPRTAPVAGASTYHRGIDVGVGAGTPLEWRGGGKFKPERGYGVIETTDPQGRPYTVKLLHTTSS